MMHCDNVLTFIVSELEETLGGDFIIEYRHSIGSYPYEIKIEGFMEWVMIFSFLDDTINCNNPNNIVTEIIYEIEIFIISKITGSHKNYEYDFLKRSFQSTKNSNVNNDLDLTHPPVSVKVSKPPS